MMSFFHNLKFIHITLTVDGYRGSLNRQEGCLQHICKNRICCPSVHWRMIKYRDNCKCILLLDTFLTICLSNVDISNYYQQMQVITHHFLRGI